MPVSGKRSQIEERLGEPIQTFVGKRLTEGRSLTAIGREIGIDRKTVKYYVDKYDIVHPLESAGPPRKKLPRSEKLMGSHVRGCLCALCSTKECQDHAISHKKGRCVLVCLDSHGKSAAELSV